ncbi:DMT family transporter [Cumulibacter manganitolerans]|uniref:DMT family transporter n=1 Tax=Cumulibacter manganitolerans TaxID=1884992 RepID=UPI001295B0D2|nr:multidrug efflux SMR transporter [Cumulibacter manganitolerans]
MTAPKALAGHPRRSGWLWILVAGLFEVGFTVALKLQQQDARFGVLFGACAIASFACLSRGIRTIPLSIGYAVWTGIGSVGAVAVGIAAFGDPASLLRIGLVAGLIVALVALKLAGAHGEPARDEPDAGVDARLESEARG